MRNIDKIVESQYPPKQTNVLWFDTTTSELKIYMNGVWVHADGLDDIATDEDIDSITNGKRQYFTIETIANGLTLSWLQPMPEQESHACTIEYSTDDGETWHSVTSGYDNSGNIDSSIPAGTKFIFRGNGPTGFYDSEDDEVMGSFFNAGGACYVYGNAMSLLYGDNFATKTAVPEYAFANLFYDYAEEYGAASWVHSKKGCPLFLPATTLADSCYQYMFRGCTSLTAAPELPATTLAPSCYLGMFEGCTSLASAPELPATTLGFSCYSGMFSYCSSLTVAPELPATTLASDCYANMFNGCTSLASVKCLASEVSPSSAVSNWLNDVATTGNFTKAEGVEWPSGASGIPSDWTVIEE